LPEKLKTTNKHESGAGMESFVSISGSNRSVFGRDFEARFFCKRGCMRWKSVYNGWEGYSCHEEDVVL
jgi:hypothetical protein